MSLALRPALYVLAAELSESMPTRVRT